MLFGLILLNKTFWIILACFRGFFEGNIWHLNSLSKNKLQRDLHPDIFIERSVLFIAFILPVFLISILENNIWAPVFFGLSLFFTYPFFHNGMKYRTRNVLNQGIYLKRWKSEPSTTSIAKMNLSWNQRKISFGLGLILFIISLIISW